MPDNQKTDTSNKVEPVEHDTKSPRLPLSASPGQPSPPRKRGAPKGNQNALKHGLYARSFKISDRRALRNTPHVSLADEIDLMRVCIRRMCEAYSPDLDFPAQTAFLRTLSLAFVSLNRMVRTQRQIAAPEEDAELRQVIDKALSEVTQELGLDDRFPRS